MKRDYNELQVRCTIHDFYTLVDKILNLKKKLLLSIIGWQNGDYFFEIVNDNGGIDLESEELFKKLPVYHENIQDLSSFRKIVALFMEKKSFKSRNNKYNYIYDIYITTNTKMIIFNPYLEKLFETNIPFLKRITGAIVNPPWIDHKMVLNTNSC